MEKTVHLLRHAEGYHNAQGEILLQALDIKGVLLQGRWKRLRIHHLVRAVCCAFRLLCGVLFRNIVGTPKSTKSFTSPYEHTDASLTSTGWQQVAEQRKHMAEFGVELVVVSPLKRTLQTAAGVFARAEYRKYEDRPPLMADKVGRCPQPAISSAGCPPFLAVELCRELMSTLPCDKRSPLSECSKEFPAVDFSKVDGEDDKLWKFTSPESREELSIRVRAFVEWLSNRPEKEIAVVSHGGFLTALLGLFGGSGIVCSRFENCELRTFKMRETSTGSIIFDEVV